MSKFFKALEQAERDRAVQEAAGRALNPAGSERAAPLVEPAADTAPPTTLEVPSRPGNALPLSGVTALGEDAPAPLGSGRSLGEIGDPLPEIDEHLVSLVDPTSFAAEQYRALRHLVEHLHNTADLSTLAVTSPGVGDGKTMTAINLAGALAQGLGARVLLVEADLRRPAVAHQLGLPELRPGLTDAILDPRLDLDAVIRPCGRSTLAVLLAGDSPEASYEVLKSGRFHDLLADARRRYDYVILDTPPIVPLPDGRLIQRLVDGVLVVVAANRTPRKLLEEALGTLDAVKVVGLVFNGDDRPLGGYYAGYYGGYAARPLLATPAGRNGQTGNGHRASWWSRLRWR